MDLACDIVKKREITNGKISVLNKFKNMNLREDIDKKIKQHNYIEESNNILNAIFETSNKDFGFSILFAYYISTYSNTIFSKNKSDLARRLIFAANSVVVQIEHIATEDNLEEFYNAVDNYYSLYKIWSSRDSLNKIEILLESLINETKIYRLKLLKNMDITSMDDRMDSIIDKMFSINKNFTIKILLDNYDYLCVVKDLKDVIWRKILEAMGEYRENIILMMITGIKIHLIHLLKNSEDRRDIYYKLDNENIIKTIRDNNLTPEKTSYLMQILVDKINKLDNKNRINFRLVGKSWNSTIDIHIIETFKLMFDFIYNNEN